MALKEGDKRIGNQFWKIRSRHGRKTLFKSPKILQREAFKYFQWCVDNPLIEAQVVKGREYTKGGQDNPDREKIKTSKPYVIAELPKMRPFTMEGLCHFLRCNKGYFNDFDRNIKDSKEQINIDFSVIITHIREIIYRQKFEGAAAGFLNANIIARDLGLTDKKEHSIKHEQPLFGDDKDLN